MARLGRAQPFSPKLAHRAVFIAAAVTSFSGSGGLVASVPTFNGSGTESFNGSGSLTEQVAVFSGSGAQTFTGSGGFVASVPTFAATGTESFSESSGSFVEAVPVFAGSGTLPISGSGNLSASASMSGVGTNASVGNPTGGGDSRRLLRQLFADPALAAVLAEEDEDFAALLQLTVQTR